MDRLGTDNIASLPHLLTTLAICAGSGRINPLAAYNIAVASQRLNPLLSHNLLAASQPTNQLFAASETMRRCPPRKASEVLAAYEPNALAPASEFPAGRAAGDPPVNPRCHPVGVADRLEETISPPLRRGLATYTTPQRPNALLAYNDQVNALAASPEIVPLPVAAHACRPVGDQPMRRPCSPADAEELPKKAIPVRIECEILVKFVQGNDLRAQPRPEPAPPAQAPAPAEAAETAPEPPLAPEPLVPIEPRLHAQEAETRARAWAAAEAAAAFEAALYAALEAAPAIAPDVAPEIARGAAPDVAPAAAPESVQAIAPNPPPPRQTHWMMEADLKPFDPGHRYTPDELRALAAAYCKLNSIRGRPLGGDAGRRQYSKAGLLPHIPQGLWPMQSKSPR